MSLIVSGSSDDIISVEGDINEEFYYTGDRPNRCGDLLAFSDGTILRIRFDNDRGGWRIELVVRGSGNPVIEQAAEDAEDTTDAARLGGAKWVVHGIGWAK